MRLSVNKLNLVPNRKVPSLVGMFRNCGVLSTSKPHVSVVFLYYFTHRSPGFTDIYFAAFTWNLIDNIVSFLARVTELAIYEFITCKLASDTSRVNGVCVK